ncbi:hypothetical protein [Bremerella sp. P1]|uniref:hypothetical protein n=1 Tax=Bremerella sp. P1 TaxID=3026424 RepID=UPI002367C2F7|nr:hypothetical protein [Bremerella sp. P1]WDI43034.1 hypothetical protein PSR63_03625 [Bremerella sp. P1]
MKAKLQIMGGILVLVLVECVVAYLIIPSPQDVIRAAEMQAQSGQTDGTMMKQELQPLSADEETVEVDLGKPFGITAYRPLSESTMRIDFHLYATIRASDEADFTASMEKNENRFREQVIVTVRSSDEGELTDPSLGLLKRKILEKTNNILGKPMVHSIVFSEFSFVEQ